MSCGGKSGSGSKSPELTFPAATAFDIEAEGVNYLGHFRHDRKIRYSSCWGYSANGREYALLGVYDGLSVVDITDAPILKEISFIPGPSSIWKEIKTYKHYAYIVNEQEGGMQIIDLSQLPLKAELIATYTGFQTAHNIHVDESRSILLAEGTSSVPVRVLSLADPINPTVLGETGQGAAHDMMSFKNRV